MIKLFIISLLMLSCAHQSPLKEFTFSEKHMGTDFRLILFSKSQKHAEQAAKNAFDRIKQIDESCSDYIAESELSRLSRTHNEWIAVSKDLWNVLNYAQELSSKSKGAFDVTCGPLTLKWRIARYQGKRPTDNELKRSLARTGYQKLLLNSESQSVKLTQAGMRLDLGALAKGYAADQALLALKSNKIQYALIDASGDMLMTDHPHSYWKIYINDQNSSQGSRYLKLQAGAIATSGDAIQHLKINAQKHSHIIDPRTGQALINSPRVTIISKTAMQADALASCLSVLPLSQGFELISALPQTAALLQTSETTHSSPHFPTTHTKELTP